AALAATLYAYRDGTAEAEIPVWRMIATPLAELETRSTQWVKSLQQLGIGAHVQEGFSTVGGGSMPGETLPTCLCAVAPGTFRLRRGEDAQDAERDAVAWLASRLRRGERPVVARVQREHLLL